MASRWALWVVVALSVLYAGVALHATRGVEVVPPDALSYLIAARSLLEGQGYSVNFLDLHFGLDQPLPHVLEMHGLVQPLLLAPLLALFEGEVSVVRIPGILYTVGAALFAFFLARREFGPTSGVLAAVLVLTNVSLLAYSTLGADDVGFAFLFIAMLNFVHRGLVSERDADFWIAGVVAGAASLMKPLGLFQPLAFGAVLIAWPRVGLRGIVRWSVCFAVPFGVLSAAYVVRNYLVHGGTGGRVSPLNIVQKTLGGEAIYEIFETTPSLASVVERVGAQALFESAQRQLGHFFLHDFAAIVRFDIGPTGFGAWFGAALTLSAIIGLALWGRSHPRFAALFAFSTLGSVLFVCVLWHYDPRYLALLIPVSAVATAGIPSLLADAQSASGARTGARRWGARLAAAGALALTLVSVFGFVGLVRATPEITVELNARNRAAGCREALEWIARETAPDARVLAFAPAAVDWYAGRAGIVLPSGGVEPIERVARHYGAHWLLVQPYARRNPTRQYARKLIDGEGELAVRKAHGRGACRVYRLDWDAT